MVTKAIIPVAGWGTRRLPITKAIEKCMLPIGNQPVIDFIVQDCLLAGIIDIYFVVSGEATQLRDYYSSQPHLEAYLETNNKHDLVQLITPPQGVNFYFVHQDTINGKYGTAVPVWLCREYVGRDEQVLVIMGDQFFYRTDGGSNAADLIRLVEKRGLRSGLLGVPVLLHEVEKYGVIEKDDGDLFVRIVEHPKPSEAPSNLNNASFYLFDQPMFDYLDREVAKPQNGEYWIIDPINEYVKDGNRLVVGEAKGEYLDAGSLEGWLKANQVVLGQNSV